MKRLFLALASLVITTQAHALAVAEFSSQFITALNNRIKVENETRSEAKKTLYCARLSKAQIVLIQKTAAKPDITVGEFVETVTESLKCYPEFWAPWGRKNLGGVALNTKAYIMDNYIVRDALEDLAPGRSPTDQEPLLFFNETW